MKRSIFFLLLISVLLLTVSVCFAGDLESVKDSGVLRFGVPGNYPPFAYMDGTTPDGLDIAIMREICSRIGVQLKPTDMAFDGLYDALMIGQIDLIGGAVSITDARKQKVDFTKPYYQAKGVIIGRTGHEVTEENISLAKVGVETGTVFHQWASTNLLMGGHIAADAIRTFDSSAAMMKALKMGNIDCCLIDEDVWLTAYRSDSEFTLLNGEIAGQRYAFACVLGSTLVPEIDRVFAEMIKDGTAQRLANDYFSRDYSKFINNEATARTDEVPALATQAVAAAQATALASPAQQSDATRSANCYNGMQFVSDSSMPDGTVLGHNVQATKTWTVLNTGTCTWDTSYTLNYERGDLFGSTTVHVPCSVAPNETCQLSVPVLTPPYDGDFVSYWQMANGAGVRFGQTIWFNFLSKSGGSSDSKTMSGVPQILKWTPSSYRSDKCPVVSWSVSNARSVEFYINNQFQKSVNEMSGSTKLCPPNKHGNYTYAIRAVGDGAVSDAFQFTYSKDTSNPAVGVAAEWPHK